LLGHKLANALHDLLFHRQDLQVDGQGVVSTDATLTDRVGELFNELTGRHTPGAAASSEALMLGSSPTFEQQT
jgi:hypothetical protein